MGTVQRFAGGKVKVVIREDDHFPAHAHVLSPDCQVVVDLGTLKVTRTRGKMDGNVREALAWVRANGPLLMRTWNEIHGKR
jgi:hypothetical protein